MKDRAHDEAMAELLREDPAFATQYLNAVLQEGDEADLKIALRQLAHQQVGANMQPEELRAAIAAGLAGGPGQSASAVFDRLEEKYRKPADKR